MIICTKHKIIYLSNCKCASSTIRKYFWEIRDHEIVDGIEKQGNGNPHMPYDKVAKFLTKNYDIDIDTFFLFSTIRNPWERIVSLYNYSKPDKNGVPFWSPRFGIEREEGTSCSFEKFILSGLDYKRNTSGSFVHACKNVRDMFGKDYHKFKLYKTEELDIDKIMDDINDPSLEAKLGRSELKIVDSTHWHMEKEKRDSENYREYYTDEVRDIISDHYKLDIQIGGYEF